jgi:hypothetical protein
MKLRMYLTERRITNKEFGKKIGYNQFYVAQIRSGIKKPGKGIMRAIIAETNGLVTEEDFRDHSEKSIPESTNLL